MCHMSHCKTGFGFRWNNRRQQQVGYAVNRRLFIWRLFNLKNQLALPILSGARQVLDCYKSRQCHGVRLWLTTFFTGGRLQLLFALLLLQLNINLQVSVRLQWQ